MLHSLRRFKKDEVARERVKILQFYTKHGEEATREAFGVDRKLIHVWRKRLEGGGNQLDALIPESTKPHRVRAMTTHPQIIEFLRQMRRAHPRIGKEKLKPLLDGYCKGQGIASVSESTIGKLITRHKFFFQKAGRVSHDPNSGWARQGRHRGKRLRVRRPPRHTEMGHFQADTAFQFVQGIKRYLISAIDTKGKFSFSSCYPQLPSRHSVDFLTRLQRVYPLPVKSIQTDNGGEFLGEFEAYLKRKGIPHYFTYPRCPKINGCIERFNRTLKEEFVAHHIDVLHDLPLFRQRLTEYLIFYNTQRPHKALHLKSPIDYLISEGGMSKKIATRTLR